MLLLEFLRRLQREYDRLIRTQHGPVAGHHGFSPAKQPDSGAGDAEEQPPHSAVPLLGPRPGAAPLRGREAAHFVPTVGQQAIRAGIYMLQFATAYLVMLLAMYYNGYVLLCIFVGAFVGFFVFSWDLASGAVGL